MPGPFQTRGAQPINDKPMKYVPIFVGKFFTGLFTNRNPLNEGAVTDIYSKFYQANRNDSLIDGLNTELSPRMTLVRRPGSSVYNPNTFNPTNSYVNFKPFQTGVGEFIYVIADSASDVRVVNNGQNTVLYNKSFGASTVTDTNPAGSGVNDSGAVWLNPNNITSSSSYASISLSGFPNPISSGNLLVESFSFSANGDVVNIQTKFNYFYSLSFIKTEISVQLLKAGVPFGAPQLISLPVGSFGSSGTPIQSVLTFPVLGLLASDVNNSAFGFQISTSVAHSSVLTLFVNGGNIAVSSQTANSSPAGPMRAQQILNTLYMVDGVNARQWTWFPPWQPGNSYTQQQSSPDANNTILDANNNFQVSTGYSIAITSTSAASGTLTVNYTGSANVNAGDTWTFIGLQNATGLNLNTATILTTGVGTFTANTSLSDYATLPETNGLAFLLGTAGASAQTIPTFNSVSGGTTLDNTVGWINKGSSVQTMGITGPSTAPSVSLQSFTPVNPNTGQPYASWAANTFYWKSTPLIIQGLNVWQLTTAGTTSGSTPAFAGGTGSIQIDGTAVWTNIGPATRAPSNAYSVGQAIQVNTSKTRILHSRILGDQEITTYYSSLMVVFKAGVTGSAPTDAISWNTSTGATNLDGTVQWIVAATIIQNQAYSNPILARGTTTSSSIVGNSQIVSLVTQIDDASSGGQGNLQSIVGKWGESGASAPATWASSTGLTTQDSGVSWICGGPLSVTNTGALAYAFSYKNSITGDESTASPLSLPILLTSGNEVAVVGPSSTEEEVDTICVYRTTQGPSTSTTGGTPFFLAEFPMPASSTWQYLDNTPDPGNTGSILNIEITASGYVFSGSVVTNLNNPPPIGLTNLTFHNGWLWGTVGNIVYLNTGPNVTVGNGGSAWSPLNFYEFPGAAHRLISTNFNGATLFVYTSSGQYAIPGQGTVSNPYQQQQLVAPNISILSYDAFAQDGSTFYIFTADKNLLSQDVNSGFSDVGMPIADLLESFDPANVQLAFHVNNTDRALYISDFETGWYRLSAVSAPETGFFWSPKAKIVGGISSISSVTTAPGIHSLLIGPKTNGPILERDNTVHTDNLATYSSWAVVGNLVLAHPGSMSTIRFIALEALKVGKKPSIGLLFDEFLGQPTTPPFSVLKNPTNDPPKLNASNTLYSLRYWLYEDKSPFWGKSVLVKFDFGDDEAANEICSFSIYGGVLSE